MKILMANTFYFQRGGDSIYSFELTRLLESKGHKVIPFAMNSNNNIESLYSKYFVSNIDYAAILQSKGFLNSAKVFYRSIYSVEARNNIQSLIYEITPDVAHFQSIHHHLTPSIIKPLKKYGIPIVWTLHDLKLVCPNTHFLNNGIICEACSKYRYYPSIAKKCKKNSILASMVICLEAYIHQCLKVNKSIDRFIAPSRFLFNKLVEHGIEQDRISYIPNFISEWNQDTAPGEQILYIGRLSPEKGVGVLLRAISGIDGAELLIAGDGQSRNELIDFAGTITRSKVTFLGHIDSDQVKLLLRKALVVVVPSQCYENCPMSILEAFAMKKPVIGARIGGIPELIEDGKSGLLFKSGDHEDLREKIEFLIKNRAAAAAMGNHGNKKASSIYNEKNHYINLLQVYEEVING